MKKYLIGLVALASSCASLPVPAAMVNLAPGDQAVCQAPSPEPIPTVTVTPAPIVIVSPSPVPFPVPGPTVTATPPPMVCIPSPSPAPAASASPSPVPSPTPTPSPATSASPSPKPSPSPLVLAPYINPNLQGQQLCPAGHLIHQDVSDPVKYPANPAWLATKPDGTFGYLHYTGGNLHPIGGAPIIGSDGQYHQQGMTYYDSSKMPLVTLTLGAYAKESDAGPYALPNDPQVIQFGGGDQHVLGYDPTTNQGFGLWHAANASGWTADAAARWDFNTCQPRTPEFTSENAAGIPSLAVTTRYDELAAGKILHAMGITLSCTAPTQYAPATHHTSTGAAVCAPMGTRLRLRADFPCVHPAPAFPNYTWPAFEQTVCQYGKTVGFIVMDNGANFDLLVAPDARFNDGELHTLNYIAGTDLEMVNQGPALP